MSFGEPITVPPGAQITIKNNDSVEHSVTSDTAGKFDVDVDGKRARNIRGADPNRANTRSTANITPRCTGR